MSPWQLIKAWRASYLLDAKRAERKRLFKERRTHKPHSLKRADISRKLRAVTVEILSLETLCRGTIFDKRRAAE